MGDANWSNVTLLMHCDDFSDVVTATNATNSGSVATIDSGTVKFGSGSIKTGASALYYANSSNWDFGTGPFTIEFWFNLPSTGGNKALLAHYAFNSGNWPNFIVALSGGALKLMYTDASGVAHNSNNTSGQSYLANTWYAVCVERDASNNLRIYVNGVQRSKTTSYTYSFSGFTTPLIIGSLRPDLTTWDALGYFDEIRITKGVARYASDSGYTVQTAAFPDAAAVTHNGSLAQSLAAATLVGTGTVIPSHNGSLVATLDSVTLGAKGRTKKPRCAAAMLIGA